MTTEIKTEQAAVTLAELFDQVHELALCVPDDIYCCTSVTHEAPQRKPIADLRMQAPTQAEVRAVRAAFPGAIWKKQFQSGLNWWRYDTRVGDVELAIIACREAPPTCKAVKKTRLVAKQVPIGEVQYETREVEEEYVEWDCSNGDTA